MDIYSSRMTANDGTVYWVVFPFGKIRKPITVLTDMEMKRFLNHCQEQVTEAEEKERK